MPPKRSTTSKQTNQKKKQRGAADTGKYFTRISHVKSSTTSLKVIDRQPRRKARERSKTPRKCNRLSARLRGKN